MCESRNVVKQWRDAEGMPKQLNSSMRVRITAGLQLEGWQTLSGSSHATDLCDAAIHAGEQPDNSHTEYLQDTTGSSRSVRRLANDLSTIGSF